MKNITMTKITAIIMTLAILLTSACCYSYASSKKGISNHIPDNAMPIDEYQSSVSTKTAVTDIVTVNDSQSKELESVIPENVTVDNVDSENKNGLALEKNAVKTEKVTNPSKQTTTNSEELPANKTATSSTDKVVSSTPKKDVTRHYNETTNKETTTYTQNTKNNASEVKQETTSINNSESPKTEPVTENKQIKYNHSMLDSTLNIDTNSFVVPAQTPTKGKSIAVKGIISLNFKANQTEQVCHLENSIKNPCFMVYTITLADTNEVIYQSGLIPPGYAVENIELNRTLEPGEYPLLVKITTYSFDQEMRGLNNAAIKTTAYVS